MSFPGNYNYEKAKKAARVNVPKVKNVSLRACFRRFGRQRFMHIAQNISAQVKQNAVFVKNPKIVPPYVKIVCFPMCSSLIK